MNDMTSQNAITIRPALVEDAKLVLQFIKGLAEYEKLSDEVVATEANIRESLFGPNANAEAFFAYHGTEAVGCAIFCQHYSTYSGRSSLYLEDIFVLPDWRSHGVGRELMAYPRSRLSPDGMVGIGLERAGHRVLRKLGRRAG